PEGSDVRFVYSRRMCCRVIVCRDCANHSVAHVIQLVVIGDITRTKEPNPGVSEATLCKLFGESHFARWREHKDGIRSVIARLLEERREIEVLKWDAKSFNDFAADRGEALFERDLGFDAGSVIRNNGHYPPDAVLGRPIAQDHR